jgi:tetratricopeptide (TPR) repeat protein
VKKKEHAVSHLWLKSSRFPVDLPDAAGLPALLPPVDAHRRLRGPYTAAGTVLRGLAPALLEHRPELVREHDVEVLSAAPELRDVVLASRETLTSLAVPGERTRFYSRLRTRRIAHGIVDLLCDHLADGPRHTLVIENAQHVDPTDAELLAIMLRRSDPSLLTLVVCAGAGPGEPELSDALLRYARECAMPEGSGRDQAAGGDRGESLAAAYVATECTSEDPALINAYHAADPAARARLHDTRAGELAARGEQSLRYGAIPYHLERGTDPAGAGAEALGAALDHCIDMGFYDATVDFGRRGRAVIDWSAQAELWWTFTTKMTTSLAALSRPEEAEALYDEARAISVSPQVHMQAAYATAMLFTRHHEPERRDHQKAMAWINESIAIASLLPDTAERAFQTVFGQNGRALIHVHMGEPDAALGIVNAGLAYLDSELSPGTHRLHRSVLLYNRAQVLAGMGRFDETLADYTAVIDADPNYAEYYLDRGNILRRLGRDGEALADYEMAIRLSPPFPEVYYNLADTLMALGDLEGGLAALGRLLELDPEYVDAYVNRAGARVALDDLEGARQDAEAGLALDPDNAHLHCVLGQVHAAQDRLAEARAEFDRAIERDPALQAAWSGRAALAYQQGDAATALEDLNQSLNLGEDAALRYNRAMAYRALGRISEALADLDAAAALDSADDDIAQCRRELERNRV